MRTLGLALLGILTLASCDKKTDPAEQARLDLENRPVLNRRAFTHPDAVITDNIGGITAHTPVTSSFTWDPAHPTQPSSFSGGNKKYVDQQYQGGFHYQFMGRALDDQRTPIGDVYLFTIEDPRHHKKTIPILYRGTPLTIHQQDGIHLTLSQ